MRHITLGGLVPSRSKVLQQRVLGTEATYRVLHQTKSIVQVEAIDVPGMRPGTRLYMTAAAAANMQRAPVGVARRARRVVHLPARTAARTA